jgi:hypothetical protein
MKAKYTKGEWIAKDGQIYLQETGITLGLIVYYDESNEEHKANEQLIAAAPKMLEALEFAYSQFRKFEKAYGTGDCEAVLKIREALETANQTEL